MQVGRSESPTGPMPPPAAAPKPAAPKTPDLPADRLTAKAPPPLTEAERLSQVRAAVEAARQAAPKRHPYHPPEVSRPVYTGGAPALKPTEMDPAVVKNNLILRLLYGIRERAAWPLKTYMAVTKVIGPIGAWVNLGYNALSAKRILTDPKAPGFLKAGIVGSTALAGVSAVTATRVGLAAFNVWPMASEGLKLFGRVSGIAGVGAGAILSAMDTFNTFRDPKATPAQKGFSALATGASVGLTLAMLLGITGPIGIGLGIGAIAFSLFKGFLGKNPVANAVFSGVGKVLAPVGNALSSVGKGIGRLATSLFD